MYVDMLGTALIVIVSGYYRFMRVSGVCTIKLRCSVEAGGVGVAEDWCADAWQRTNGKHCWRVRLAS